MNSPYKIIDLFAGLGGIRLPFEEKGCECVFTSEWDKYACDMYEGFYGERPHGDITQISPEDIPDHDILLAGFPCQAFSICGDMKGFQDTRGTLFFNIEQILRAKQPYAFLLENVKQLKSHDKGRTFKVIIEHLEALNYHVHHTVLNALDYGLPQKRERTFIVGFKDNLKFHWPKSIGEHDPLDSILEPDDQIDPKYFASEKIQKSRLQNLKKQPVYPSIWHQNKSGNVSPLPYSCALRAGGSYNYLLVNGVRRPTGREMLRLQGFPDNYRINVSYTQVRKLAGNSVAVPVIRAICHEMMHSLETRELTTLGKQQKLFNPVVHDTSGSQASLRQSY